MKIDLCYIRVQSFQCTNMNIFTPFLLKKYFAKKRDWSLAAISETSKRIKDKECTLFVWSMQHTLSAAYTKIVIDWIYMIGFGRNFVGGILINIAISLVCITGEWLELHVIVSLDNTISLCFVSVCSLQQNVFFHSK